tara:strand:- start:256 stop:426 length:171 start_codon:yes stop_codon:yes gene_type:complete
MLTTKSAHAYLDPGTFTIVVNFIIALFAGIIAYITMFWIKIKNFFSKIFKKKKNKE